MRCFVIGPIGDQLAEAGSDEREAYENGLEVLEVVIKAACERQSPPIEAFRADEIDIPGEIPQQVFEALRDEELVIADLTDANPNVMYELGIRHALGKCTIQIGERGKLPFDVSTIRTVKFVRSPSGLVAARDRLERVITAAASGDCPPTTVGRIVVEGQPATPPGEPRQVDIIPGIEEEPGDEAEDLGNVDVDEEAPGFLEALDETERSIPELGQKIEILGELMGELGAIAQRHTPEMANAPSAGAKLAVASRYASDLAPVARQMDKESVELEALAKSLDGGIQVLFTKLRSDPEARTNNGEFLESLVTMGETSRENADDLSGFIDIVHSQIDTARSLRPVMRLLEAALRRTSKDFLVFANWGASAKAILDSGVGIS